ncbi:MAG: type II toxin-antitoxin system VapC family toxin [Limisphaerales bacterium]
MHLLDTNAWKWLAQGKKLKPSAAFLARKDTPLYLLDISLWEICKAEETGKFETTLPIGEWIERALARNVTTLSITPEIAVRSCGLACEGLRTEDPADQLITAAALCHRLVLVTRDSAIHDWGGVPVLDY